MSFALRGAVGISSFFRPCFSIFQRSNRVSTHAYHRSISSNALGSSPSQLPGPGEPGWKSFVANVERYKIQPALSPADLQGRQRLSEMEQRLARVEKMFSKLENMVGDVQDIKSLVQKMATPQ